MAKQEDVKIQRDRFLAFAFASADLFIEVSEEGKIVFCLGAAKGLIGIDDKELMSKNWLELFSTFDQQQILNLFETSKPGARCGPLLVDLNEMIIKRKAVFTGIKMPGSSKFYITLGLSNLVMSKIAGMSPSAPGELLDRSSFVDIAQDTFEFARTLGQDLDMTVLDFTPTEDDRHRMGEENWGNMLDSVASFLQSQSVDGNSAAQIANGRYSVIHDKDVNTDALREKMEKIAEENDPTGEGVNVRAKTITSKLSALSERDAAKALVYTINEFERKGTELTIETLNNGLQKYAEANAEKMQEFQSLIDRLDFKLHYQAIVDLKTREVSHYEMLSRFNSGDTLEWVMFGEDMGMATKFDAAVCELAINTITRKFAGSRSKFSINLSGQSVEDDEFCMELKEKLTADPTLKDRIMFEITESTHMNDLNKVNQFIETLQAEGFKVALDDFGAGNASFQYIQKLKVDVVKIDGKYIRKLLSSSRDAAMVKNLVRMCQDLNIEVIAEYVEDEDQADVLQEMGVKYAQGFFFGAPQQAPDYRPPSN